MKKLISTLFILGLYTISSYAQDAKVLKKSGIKIASSGPKYAFIEPSIDTSQLQFVATVQAKAKNRKPVIGSMYFSIREEAKKLGANCFLINHYVADTLNNISILILDSYYTPDSVLAINTESHEKNSVFIFGKEEDDGKTMSCFIKGEKKEIKHGTFLKFVLKEEDYFELSKGGIAGESVTIRWEYNMQPAFYSLSGFHLSELNSMGVGFSSGSINKFSNISYGLLLTQLLKQGN